jgi:hypothetical protein
MIMLLAYLPPDYRLFRYGSSRRVRAKHNDTLIFT